MRTFVLAAALVSCALAQGPTDAPPIIQIVSKAGGANASTRPYASASAAIDVLGLAAVTGLPQTWMLEMHPNFASIEDLDRAIAPIERTRLVSENPSQASDDLLAPPRTVTAILRPALSFHPEQAIRALPKARYIRVTVHRVRPGLEADFAHVVNLRQLSADTISLDRPDLAYQVISGAPSSTYIVLQPINSLRALDDGVPDIPAYAAPIVDARAKAEPKAADFLLGREHILFRVEPGLSYVSNEFAAADIDFWRGKNSAR